MEKVYIRYIDSNIIADQTDEIVKVAIIEAIGFLIWENSENYVLARELIKDEYRGQVAIPRKCVLEFKQLYDHTE